MDGLESGGDRGRSHGLETDCWQMDLGKGASDLSSGGQLLPEATSWTCDVGRLSCCLNCLLSQLRDIPT